MKATIYGDSLLRFTLLEGAAYHSNKEYQQQFEMQYQINIDNHSYFGSTVDKGLMRLKRDLDKGLSLGEWCVWEFGANDSDYDWKAVSDFPEESHSSATEESAFLRMMREALALLRQNGAKPILMTLPPLVPERYLNWVTRTGYSKENILRSIGGLSSIGRTEAHYSSLIEKLAADENVSLVDIRRRFLTKQNWEDLFCPDGVHPNRAGQKVIYEAFADFAEEQRNEEYGSAEKGNGSAVLLPPL